MGLEQDIIDEMNRRMATEMDFSMIADIFTETGWTNVQLKRFRNNQEAVDINIWLEQNCIGQWKNLSTRYIFEKKQDAEWFILRWQ